MITASLEIPALQAGRLIQDAVTAAVARLADTAVASSPTSGLDAAPPPVIALIQIIG